MRSIKRIIKIHEIKGYNIYCLFNNGESRIIDFAVLFDKWSTDEHSLEYPIKKSISEFKKVAVIDGTLTWSNIEVLSEDEEGNSVVYPYDIDPISLYEQSTLDESRQLEIGLLIKKTRNEIGLTQEQLAQKSGTSKHYISRVENNRTGLELATLKRIVEGGLGKRIKISIE